MYSVIPSILFQFYMLVFTLILSILAQIVAGVCFFIAHQREINGMRDKPSVDWTAYGCVGLVMILNIFIACFDATWSGGPPPEKSN